MKRNEWASPPAQFLCDEVHWPGFSRWLHDARRVRRAYPAARHALLEHDATRALMLSLSDYVQVASSSGVADTGAAVTQIDAINASSNVWIAIGRPVAPPSQSVLQSGRELLFCQTRIASWYGLQLHGRRTANAEHHNVLAVTAALRTLPRAADMRAAGLQRSCRRHFVSLRRRRGVDSLSAHQQEQFKSIEGRGPCVLESR